MYVFGIDNQLQQKHCPSAASVGAGDPTPGAPLQPPAGCAFLRGITGRRLSLHEQSSRALGENSHINHSRTNAISWLVSMDVVMAMQAGFGASEVSDRSICYSCQTGKAETLRVETKRVACQACVSFACIQDRDRANPLGIDVDRTAPAQIVRQLSRQVLLSFLLCRCPMPSCESWNPGLERSQRGYQRSWHTWRQALSIWTC